MPHGILQNVALAPYTTFGVGGEAEYFCEVMSVAQLNEVVVWARNVGKRITVLGGGSNVLIADTGIEGIVLHIALKGITYHENDDAMLVTALGGEPFDAFIETLVGKGIAGFENLSGIPGTVGATPIQNVGAYGVEVKDFIMCVEAYDTTHNKMVTLDRDSCAFGYRDSFFKHDAGTHLIITAVTFAFPKITQPKLSYKDLAQYFGEHKSPTLREIREAVIAIRKEKFPDWNVVGTAGSFFKNPIISKDTYTALIHQFPEIPAYPEKDGRMKIALGYVLDKILNLKGYREGQIGLYEKQALVLVQYGKGMHTHGNVTTEDILKFASMIIARVHDATGIVIEQEVNVIR